MRYRRVTPYPPEYDGALRSALHMAADRVEPGAEGLDHIRAKIAAKQSARRTLGWWSAAAQGDRPWWHALLPPPGWFPAAVGAVAERFRPDPLRAGWFGWLRPAAAVITGLFVATAASWAVAALPSALSPSSPTKTQTTPSYTHKPRHSVSGSQGYTGTTGGGTTPSGQGSSGGGGSTGATTPSCSPTSTGSPTTTPSGSPSPTTTPSSSGSPSPTTTPTSTPPPSTSTTPTQNTPTSSPTPGGPTSAAGVPAAAWAQAGGWAAADRPAPADSPEATGKALLSPDAIAATVLARTSTAGGLSERWKDATRGISGSEVLPATQPTASPTLGSPVPSSTPPPPC
ncbi:MAG TPA: hypothetical protein VEV63_07820 [Streptosporangiaceae bacterium]|nr:hypothetical protein [Streptosporangiaceae bacterium]